MGQIHRTRQEARYATPAPLGVFNTIMWTIGRKLWTACKALRYGGPLKQRTLGRAGLSISEIGFGCGPTGGLMIRSSAALRLEAIACAIDLGIDYFDTAPGYGAHASENHLGEAFQQLGVRPHIATKVALSLEDLSDIAGAVRRSVEGSLQRLRVPDVALIQLHNRIGAARAAKAPFGTGALLTPADVLGPGGVVEAFENLRGRGLVRRFGLSAFGGDMPLVAAAIDSGRVDVLTTHYSILNRTAWSGAASGGELDYGGVGKRAAASGMGTVALRVLEGGLLAPSGGRGAGDSASGDRATRLASLLRTAGLDAAEGAIRYALSNAEIGTVLIGFSDAEQIRKAVEYASRGPLTSELAAMIEET